MMKYYYKNFPDNEKEKTYIDIVEEAVDLYNEIYKEDGFIMVMDILEDTFGSGFVENLNGLYKITVNDAFTANVLIDAFLHPKSLMLEHYRGFVYDNIYYFSEEPCDEVEMINISQLKEDEEFEERTRKALDRIEKDPNRISYSKEEFLDMIEQW